MARLNATEEQRKRFSRVTGEGDGASPPGPPGAHLPSGRA